MNITRRNIIALTLLIGLIAAYFLYVGILKGDIVFNSNFQRYVEKVAGKQMSIKKELKVTYFNKNYTIVLSTPKNKDDELYANCFEEKMRGLYYKPTYGAFQGKSNSLYGMIDHFMNNENNDQFYVVYGYNRDLKAASYEVKTNNGGLISIDIHDETYFLNTYKDIVYPVIFFRDSNKNDISRIFYGS
ncbi:hypothetical protein [Candidatus Clostridium radicumherbarum]|uniref:Uncharacterized protein n=1 Tax=Candidatus Clostridium radicumherbarum TaxID=3381662 RepID=A0ABW8TUA5_9CLOT